jgi:hypothetical protein
VRQFVRQSIAASCGSLHPCCRSSYEGIAALSGREFAANTPDLAHQAEGGGFEPPDDVAAVNGFQDRRIQPLCHPSETSAMLRAGRRRQVLHWPPRSRRGGRVAEGTRLLSEYGDQNSIAGSNPALSVQLAQLPCDLPTNSAEGVLQAARS